jgi:hypothetical protein
MLCAFSLLCTETFENKRYKAKEYNNTFEYKMDIQGRNSLGQEGLSPEQELDSVRRPKQKGDGRRSSGALVTVKGEESQRCEGKGVEKVGPKEEIREIEGRKNVSEDEVSEAAADTGKEQKLMVQSEEGERRREGGVAHQLGAKEPCTLGVPGSVWTRGKRP